MLNPPLMAPLTLSLALSLTGFIAPAAQAAPVSAVLPSSRSVVVGTPATVFATVLNPDSVAANACSISLVTSVPVDFFYQTTNPTDNTLSGSRDTPADIPAGGSQSFLIGLTPTAEFGATDVEFAFTCDTGTAANASGINTLLMAADATQAADVVAVVQTATLDGIALLPRDGAFGFFAMATTNVGTAATIRAEAVPNFGLDGFSLICETNQNTGECLAEPAVSVVAPLAADGTRTYSIFVSSREPFDLDAAGRRVVVEFRDGNGDIRGAASVAVAGGGPSARTFFGDNVSDQVLQAKCLACHIEAGEAGNTGLVFVLDEAPDYEQTNFDILEDYLEAAPGNPALLLEAAQGQQLDHPAILSADDKELADLFQFEALLESE